VGLLALRFHSIGIVWPIQMKQSSLTLKARWLLCVPRGLAVNALHVFRIVFRKILTTNRDQFIDYY
jgi:hypothetical protein